MEFLEDLPSGCPISAAKDQAVDGAYRIVSCLKPPVKDFFSAAALNIPLRPGTDPCRHASCSMFLTRDQAVAIASKLPKTRIAEPHLAICNLPEGAGKTYINRRQHVDFWPSRHFSPEDVVVETEKL